MALSGGLAATVQLAALGIFARGDTRSLVVPKLSTAVVGFGLNIIGAYVAGVKGVVAANVLYNIAFLIWVAGLLYGRRERLAASDGAG
jgi:peptidoglycan biosynthesis protein MviN/MurJ (putative lipid II flippase)